MLRTTSLVLLSLAFVASGRARAQTTPRTTASLATPSPDSLGAFLRTWVRSQRAEYELLEDTPDSTTRYRAGYVPTGRRGEPSLLLVYLVGRAWCASDGAGCHTLVVLRERGGFRVIGKVHHTHLPVGVLPDTSREWPDITVWISGGGGLGEPHHARLRYDGVSYPDDPSGAPPTDDAGHAVLSARTRWHLLYPRTIRHGPRRRAPNAH